MFCVGVSSRLQSSLESFGEIWIWIIAVHARVQYTLHTKHSAFSCVANFGGKTRTTLVNHIYIHIYNILIAAHIIERPIQSRGHVSLLLLHVDVRVFVFNYATHGG